MISLVQRDRLRGDGVRRLRGQLDTQVKRGADGAKTVDSRVEVLKEISDWFKWKRTRWVGFGILTQNSRGITYEMKVTKTDRVFHFRRGTTKKSEGPCCGCLAFAPHICFCTGHRSACYPNEADRVFVRYVLRPTEMEHGPTIQPTLPVPATGLQPPGRLFRHS